jgi:hypothetical protein
MRGLLCLLALAACSGEIVAAPHKIIHGDAGGIITEKATEIRWLRRHGTFVEIRDRCFSSCTMYLSLSNVCVHPDAGLHFHSSHGGPLEDEARRLYYNRLAAEHYPEGIRERYLDEWQHVQSGYHTINGQQAHDMAGVPLCE